MNPRHQKGFTLVELMAVILIMGLLFAVGVPALMSFRATAVSSGGRSVANTLSLARQYAITHRTRARVYFSLPNPSPGQEKAYSTYVIAAITNNITSTFGLVGQWQALPAGALFGDNTVPKGSLHLLGTERKSWGSSYNTREYAYVEFKATGGAYPTVGNFGTISVYEGIHGSDGKTPKYPREKENRIDVIFDGLVGRTKVLRQ